LRRSGLCRSGRGDWFGGYAVLFLGPDTFWLSRNQLSRLLIIWKSLNLYKSSLASSLCECSLFHAAVALFAAIVLIKCKESSTYELINNIKNSKRGKSLSTDSLHQVLKVFTEQLNYHQIEITFSSVPIKLRESN
jgi:hypothetical protein